MSEILWRENFSFEPGVVDFKLLHYVPRAIIENARTVVGSQTLQNTVIIFEEEGAHAFMPVLEIDAYVQEILHKIQTDPQWVGQIHAECRRLNKEYFRLAQEIESMDLAKLSNDELASVNQQLTDAQIQSHMVAISTTWFVDSNSQAFSQFLIDRVTKDLSDSSLDPLLVFSTLTTPTEESLLWQEQKEFLHLCLQCQKEGKINEELVSVHHKKWCWIPYTYLGPAYDVSYYVQEIQNLLGAQVDIAEMLRDAEDRARLVQAEQEKIQKQVNLSPQTQQLLAMAKDIIWLKDYRKMCLYYGFYIADKLHSECARRLFLTLSQVNYFTSHELTRALQNNTFDAHLLNERKKFSVLYYQNGQDGILAGSEARDFIKNLQFEPQEKSEDGIIKGTCACPGEATGKVKIINFPSEMSKMQPGDILVAHTTFPALVPAMKKAAAIVTEDGGVTCHAAIVSRELNIPCVVGVRQATKILKDGDVIEVNARTGTIKILSQ